MPIWGLTFQVTTQLLWVTIRPSIWPPPSWIKFVLMILITHQRMLLVQHFDCWKLIFTLFYTWAWPIWIWHVLNFTWTKKKILCRTKHHSTILNSQKHSAVIYSTPLQYVAFSLENLEPTWLGCQLTPA